MVQVKIKLCSVISLAGITSWIQRVHNEDNNCVHGIDSGDINIRNGMLVIQTVITFVVCIVCEK